MHPRWLRCSSLKYSRYSRSSRLAIEAPRSSRCDARLSSRADHVKVALATGSHRGIGLEVCRQLGRRGLRVIVTARDRDKATAAAAALAQGHGEFTPAVLDVTDMTSIRALTAMVTSTFGSVDVLVNNAAVL